MANKKKKKAVASARSYATTSSLKKPLEENLEASAEILESQESIASRELEWEQAIPLPSAEDLKRKDDLRILKMQVDEDFKRQLYKMNKLYGDKSVPQLPLTKREENVLHGFLKSTDKKSWKASKENEVDLMKSLTRIYLTLEKLEFAPSTIQQAISSSDSHSLNAVLEWICMNIPVEELPSGFYDKYEFEQDGTFKLQKHRQSEGSSSRNEERVEVEVSTIDRELELRKDGVGQLTKEEREDLKSRILASLDRMEDLDDEGEEKPASAVPIPDQYYQTALELSLSKRRAKELKKTGSLTEKKTMDEHINQLISHLKNLETSLDLETKLELDKKAEAQVLQESDVVELDNNDDDDDDTQNDDLMGTLFTDIEDTGGSASTTIKIMDLSFKGWSGSNPSDLLKEWLQKNMRHASFSTFLVPQSNTGFQSKLRMKSKENEQVFEMSSDEFIHDKNDAKEFMALKTLYHFCPTYKILSRISPPFRDVWNQWCSKEALEKELAEQARDDQRDTFLKEVLLQRARVPTRDASPKNTEERKSQNQVPGSIESLTVSKDTSFKRIFIEKQATNAYQTYLETRQTLPIYSEKKVIMDAINSNQVTVIAGDTGSGKSTQIPHFVLEGAVSSEDTRRINIICTQPRRISAISLADRVSAEMGDSPKSLGTSKSLVGYQVRMENCTSKSTVLTYCTTVRANS